MKKQHQPHIRFSGMQAFRILLFGQAISLLGTGMTRFAVMIWAFDQQGTATALALLGFFACLTYVLVSPFAGVLVDRWDRRKVMILADLGSGVMTALMLALFSFGRLEIWHLYLAEGLSGAFEAFQDPAFGASISLIVPKEDYTRSNALLGVARSAARIFAPAFAGVLFEKVGLAPVMVIDLLTMSLAVGSLRFVFLPAPEVSLEGRKAKGSFWHELRFGITYIFSRPALRTLVFTFFLINLFGTLTYFAVLSPMILARSGGDEVALGIVRTVMAAGGIVGGVLIGIWGGPQRKVKAYLYATMLSFTVGDLLIAISRSTLGWSIAGFLAELTIPFIVSPYFALWQEIIPADVQGKVFSTRDMFQILSQPFGYLAGGLLADYLFEPALQVGGVLTGVFGWLVGTGPGAGMSTMFLFTFIGGVLIGVFGLLSPALKGIDGEDIAAAEAHLELVSEA